MISGFKMTIGVKIYAIIGVCFLGLALIVSFQISRQASALSDQKRIELQNLASVVLSIIKDEYELAQKHVVTDSSARERAAERISKMRYGNGDYFWINDLEPKMIMHPTKPELNGKDISQIKDPNGLAIFVEFARVVRDQKSGYVEYQWPKPGSDTPQPKLSFVTGFEPWGWVIGTGVYIDDLNAQIWETTRYALIFAGIVLVLVGAIAVYVAGRISRAIRSMTGAMRRLAGGDIAATLPAVTGRDELADMARAMEIFRETMIDADRLRTEQGAAERQVELDRQKVMFSLAERIRQTVGVIVTGLTTMSQSAKDATTQMEKNAVQSSQRIERALGDLSAASQDVTIVATAVTELTASIEEIAEQTGRTSKSTASAMAGARAAQLVAENLTNATRSIGDISNLISAIANQTNLLALNATIEAARAGDAGRGFAVVATEVKLLAEQTARATQDIDRQVADIRSTTSSVVAAIAEINTSVDDVTATTSSIAGAVEEQSTATGEISYSVQRAAEGTRNVIEGISDLPAMAQEIKAASGSLSTVTSELGNQALMLTNEVERLLTELTDRRTAKRTVANERATLSIHGRNEPCQVIDLSTGGARIQPSSRLAVGDHCELQLSDGTHIGGQIVWIANGQCGLSFGVERLQERQIEIRRASDRHAA